MSPVCGIFFYKAGELFREGSVINGANQSILAGTNQFTNVEPNQTYLIEFSSMNLYV